MVATRILVLVLSTAIACLMFAGHPWLHLTGSRCLDQPLSYATMDASTYISRFYSPPCKVLGLTSASLDDPQLIRQRFLELFETRRQADAAGAELQCLCHAFVTLMSQATRRASVTNNIAIHSAQFNLNLDVQYNALVQYNAELEVRANQAEKQKAHLEQALQAAGRHAQTLQQTVQEVTSQLELSHRRAQAASPFFDSTISFLRSRCVQGEDKFVGCAELHQAMLEFLGEQPEQGPAPTQRQLRALLENLGFQYRQTWFQSKNTRGFRQLALREPATRVGGASVVVCGMSIDSGSE